MRLALGARCVLHPLPHTEKVECPVPAGQWLAAACAALPNAAGSGDGGGGDASGDLKKLSIKELKARGWATR
eukprot:4627090-Alexandrium_andersonii.AAC.1